MTNHKMIILDGGLGRELSRRGAPFKQPEWSALAQMEAADVVGEIHGDFIASGAGVITTNSYALVPFHIGEERFAEQGRALIDSAGKTARAAADKAGGDVQVAGSIPPLFGSYRADLYQPQRAEEIATPLIEGLLPYVDLWLCETQSLIAESVAVISFIRKIDSDNRPIWVSFTLEDSEVVSEPQLRSGEPVAEAVQAIAGQGIDAIVFNCCQPEVIAAAIAVVCEELAATGNTEMRIGAYANAFAPQARDAQANEEIDEIRPDLTPEAYLHWAQQWQELGATIVGGCCGVGPEHIAELKKHL